MKNLNDFARTIAKQEGLKESISIAQIKEVIRLVFTALSKMSVSEFAQTFGRFKP